MESIATGGEEFWDGISTPVMQMHSLVTHTLQRVGVEEAKITSVDDSSSLMLADQTVEFMVCA